MTTSETVAALGRAVPALGFGTWELEPDVAERSVRDALDLGYRHIDTAAIYGNEEAVGRAIRQCGLDRDAVFVTTKVWKDDARRDDVGKAVEASLGRLGLDHVDLLLIHWPTGPAPIEETIEALAAMQGQGRTRAIGVSNHTADQVHRAAAVAPLATNQVEYHPLLSQDRVLEACRQEGMFLTAYSPLAHGMVFDTPEIVDIAREIGRDPAQVALRWLLAQGDVAVLPRSSSRDHIAANAELDFTLSDEHRARLDALPKDRRQIDPPFAPDWDRD